MGFFILVHWVWELLGHLDLVLLWASWGASFVGIWKGGQFGGFWAESMFQK